MLIEIRNAFRKKPKAQDDCNTCRQRICCIVYDICTTRNQGRQTILIKKGGESCKNLSQEGNCKIYHTRVSYEGYAQACLEFTCDNVGPLLSNWIDENNIDIYKDSTDIGIILRKLQLFIGSRTDSIERRKFIRAYLLRKIISPSALLRELLQNSAEIEKRFSIWMNTPSLNENFDKEIILEGRL